VKPITHLFENHLQYGDLQLGYNNFPTQKITAKDFKKMMEGYEEEDYCIGG